MLASKMNTQSGRVTAVYSEEKAVAAGAWVRITLASTEQEKALCVLWNSTAIRLQLLNIRPKTLTYPAWAGEDLDRIRVPKWLFEKGSQKVETLAKVYESEKNNEVQQNRQTGKCTVRARVDRATETCCDLETGSLEQWRNMIGNEPTVRGKVKG